MKKEIKEKYKEKVEKYLKQQFPGKKLLSNVVIDEKKSEIYGFNRIMIKVVEDNDYVAYEIIKN